MNLALFFLLRWTAVTCYGNWFSAFDTDLFFVAGVALRSDFTMQVEIDLYFD